MSAKAKTRATTPDQAAPAAAQGLAPLPRTPADQRNRDLRLGFLIHDVSRMRRRAFDEFMKPLGITRAQWWVIAHLSRHDGMMQVQLATMLDVGKASLGTVVDRLEVSGLIERRPHPIDRRAKCIFMTKKAREIMSKMQAAERSYNEIVLRELDEDARNELVRLLELVKHSLARMEMANSDDID
ncbi:MAG: MarR family transcriptional regulator [Alphaproteobacteria bacterium]|jgi:DNA-binding MarR family transcriptional regulator|nr:MarR family transcriptional regulator [Alphaproteobacteria bacterium]